MADSTIHGLTELTLPELGDEQEIVDDPAGSPLGKRISLLNLYRNANWAIPVIAGIYLDAPFTLAAAAGVQSAFPTTMDAITLLANTTYRFRGQYVIINGTTTHTTAMAFAAGGGLTVTSFDYFAWLFSAATNAIATASSNVWATGIASKVLNATSAVAGTKISFEGIARINAGGTLTPQIAFSANPTGTNQMLVGSLIEFFPVGAGNVFKVGAVG